MADGLSVDTSSYPKPAIPTSPLDIAGKLGGLQQQSLQIDQAKLDQANQALGYLTRGLNSLGPNASKQDLISIGQSLVRDGLAPPAMLQNMVKDIPDDPKLMPAFIDRIRTQAQFHKEAIDYHSGMRSFDTGAGTKVIEAPQSLAGRNKPRTLYDIQTQEPPTTETQIPVKDAQGNIIGYQKQTAGPRSPLPIQQQGQPSIAPSSRPRIPVAPLPFGNIPGVEGPSRNFGGDVKGAVAEPPQTFDNRFGAAFPNSKQAQGLPTGTPFGTEEGYKQYTADQEMSTQRLQSLKPALQALPLMKGLTTGIGTETFNKALAGLNNLGWLPEGMTDKVAAYQIVNKKLADYVRSSPLSQRSDAQQALSRESSPDPKGQINQALVKLTKDAIGLDRSNAIRHMSFVSEGKDAQGRPIVTPRGDYHNYGNERSRVPEKIDERALTIDVLEPEERKRLLDRMEKEQSTPQGKKFKYTLELAHKLNLFQ